MFLGRWPPQDTWPFCGDEIFAGVGSDAGSVRETNVFVLFPFILSARMQGKCAPPRVRFTSLCLRKSSEHRAKRVAERPRSNKNDLYVSRSTSLTALHERGLRLLNSHK
jgi:hypothetical protein